MYNPIHMYDTVQYFSDPSFPNTQYDFSFCSPRRVERGVCFHSLNECNDHEECSAGILVLCLLIVCIVKVFDFKTWQVVHRKALLSGDYHLLFA